LTTVQLPLGFINSIFGMNVTELSDGSLVSRRKIYACMYECNDRSLGKHWLTYFGHSSYQSGNLVDHSWRGIPQCDAAILQLYMANLSPKA
jgi:hypothetical protein